LYRGWGEKSILADTGGAVPFVVIPPVDASLPLPVDLSNCTSTRRKLVGFGGLMRVLESQLLQPALL
jgi:hypothetical protein